MSNYSTIRPNALNMRGRSDPFQQETVFTNYSCWTNGCYANPANICWSYQSSSLSMV